MPFIGFGACNSQFLHATLKLKLRHFKIMSQYEFILFIVFSANATRLSELSTLK